MLSIMDARYFAELAFLFKNKGQEIIRIQEIESLVNTCMYANCFFPIWLETGLSQLGGMMPSITDRSVQRDIMTV